MGAADPAWKRSARLVVVLLLVALVSIAARWFPPVATPSPLAAKPPAADSRAGSPAAPPADQTGDDAPVEPQRFAAREATLLVVDVLGEPVDADVEALAAPPAEPLGPGEFRLRAEAASVRIRVHVEGRPVQRAIIPLDGGAHTLTLADTRSVRVLARCPREGCTDALRCDGAPCVREDAGADAGRARWACACTDGEVGSALTLAAAPEEAVARVAPGVEEVSIDLGDWSASVTGRWAGGGACDIAVFPDVGSGVIGACEADGSFFVSGAASGPGRVTLGDGEAMASVEVYLFPGETTDVGELHAQSVEVRGRVDADFPLTDVTFDAMPLEGALRADGTMTVRVGEVGDPVRLWLGSPEYGAFEATVPAVEGMVWRLRWREDRDPWLDLLPSDTGP